MLAWIDSTLNVRNLIPFFFFFFFILMDEQGSATIWLNRGGQMRRMWDRHKGDKKMRGAHAPFNKRCLGICSCCCQNKLLMS